MDAGTWLVQNFQSDKIQKAIAVFEMVIKVLGLMIENSPVFNKIEELLNIIFENVDADTTVPVGGITPGFVGVMDDDGGAF